DCIVGKKYCPENNSPGWDRETSLDVEVVHATCQTCKIVLVEAEATDLAMIDGVEKATLFHPIAISMSWGDTETDTENLGLEKIFNSPEFNGIALVAASGDFCYLNRCTNTPKFYGVMEPASLSNIIAVGGTSLQVSKKNDYLSESVWYGQYNSVAGSGSGCSDIFEAGPWQKKLKDWGKTNCNNKR